MATGLVALRHKARRAGISGYKTLSRDELEAALAGGKSKKAPAKKASVKRAPAKRKTAKRPATTTRKPARKTATPRGRKPATKATPSRNSTKSGRNMIESVDFNKTDGWNPRPGSPVDLIFKALKKHRGNIEKTLAALLPDMKTFVPRKKENGDVRKKDEQISFLRWRINRVKFDFVTKTGQHKASTNRAEYGTGGTGTGAFKRNGSKGTNGRKAKTTTKAPAKRGRPRKITAKRTPAKRGRPAKRK